MQEVFFMYLYDVETFMCACDRKGLAAKTMKSYEQTLRLFGQLLSVREIERTEEVKRVHIESYIDYLQKRGKYTVCAIDAPANSNNPENRSDYAKKISPTTINNYMRNMKVFFNWCVEQELIYKNPIEALLSSAIIDYCEKENTNEVKIVTDWKSIAHTLYIFNDNVLIGNSYLGSEAKNRYDISGQTFDAFIHVDGRFVKTKIECALNNMAKNEEITWCVIHVGLIDNKYHELSEQEGTRYFEIRNDLIR